MLPLKPLIVLMAAGGAAIAPSAATAGAFYLQEQSVKALGRAYSGEAADQGADELWWNPASIARSPRELYVGAHGLLLSTEVDNAGSTLTRPIPPAGLTTPVGGDPRAYNAVKNGLAPNAAFSMPLGDRFAVGLSATAPFDFTTQYEPSSWARYDTLKARVTTLDFQGTGAMRATDWLDLGVGVDAQYTNARLTQAYPNLSPLLPDGRSSVAGDGWNYGWTAGAQAHFDAFSVGASYRSAMDHDLDGTLSVNGLLGPLAGANMSVAARAKFRTPWIVNVAGRWRATPRLTLNAQVQRFGWSEYDAIRVSFAGQTQSIPQRYRDTSSAAVGLDFAATPFWTLRAGALYDETPTRNDLREAGIPDSSHWLYTIGTSVEVCPGVTLDGAFGYIDYQGGPIHTDLTFYGGTPAETVARVRGAGVGSGKIMSGGVRWRF